MSELKLDLKLLPKIRISTVPLGPTLARVSLVGSYSAHSEWVLVTARSFLRIELAAEAEDPDEVLGHGRKGYDPQSKIMKSLAKIGWHRQMRLVAFLFLLAAILSTGGVIRGQQAPAPGTSQPAPATPVPSQSGQVQGYTLSPAQEAQAIAYAEARHELYFFDVAYGVLVLIFLLVLRVAPAYRNLAARAGSGSFAQTLVFAPLLLLTIDILSLPTAIWGHRLSLKYQMSIQGWGSWTADWAKGEVIQITIGVLVIWILYAAIRESPRRWWLYFWLVSIPLIILGGVAEPLVEPWFYKYEPLAKSQPQLSARIEQMSSRAGVDIPESRIFEMIASAKLKALNAYVTGIGGTKRVVVWDTTIRRMTEDEVLFVSGHEMGHYVLGHVLDGILFSSGVLLVFLYAAAWTTWPACLF